MIRNELWCLIPGAAIARDRARNSAAYKLRNFHVKGNPPEALRVYEASGAVPYRTRSLEQFTGYFDGLELVAPGVVVPVDDWRPDPSGPRGPVIPQAGAVGRKR